MALEVELVDAKLESERAGERVELCTRAKSAVEKDEVFHQREVSWLRTQGSNAPFQRSMHREPT